MLLEHRLGPLTYISSNRPLIRQVCVWCSCGRGQVLHPLKPQSTTSTCPLVAQGQVHDTPQWTLQLWVHIHSGMIATAMMETIRITSACAGIVVGHQAVLMAMQGLLVACLLQGGSQCLPCSSSLAPCLLEWAQAGRPSRVAHCPQGCQHSPSSNKGWLSCLAQGKSFCNILSCFMLQQDVWFAVLLVKFLFELALVVNQFNTCKAASSLQQVYDMLSTLDSEHTLTCH